MPYAPIIATLGYLYDEKKDEVLLIHRNTRAHDHHLGKFNGLGGKLEKNEDIVAGMKREIMEECGSSVTKLFLKGSVNFTGFGKNGEDWLTFIFLISEWSGEPTSQGDNPEGTLLWVPKQRLLNACDDDEETRHSSKINLWPGDKFFLPLVFANSNGNQFHGYMPYSQGKPTVWSYSSVSVDQSK